MSNVVAVGLGDSLEGDGLVDTLFQLLACRDSLVDNEKRIMVPQTVLYKYRQAAAWFFTSVSDGQIKRKSRSKLNNHTIYEEFSRNKGRNSDRTIVAVYLYNVPVKGHSDSTTTGLPQNRPQVTLTVEYFDRAMLREFLFRREKVYNGVLQKFVEPKGTHNSCLRVLWSPKICAIERRVAKAPLHDLRYDVYERGLTFEGPEFLSEPEPIRGPGVPKQIHSLTKDITQHIATVTNSRVKISRMALTLKMDAHDNLWLLYVSSVRLTDEWHRTMMQHGLRNNPLVKAGILNTPLEWRTTLGLPSSVRVGGSVVARNPVELQLKAKCNNCGKMVVPSGIYDISFLAVIKWSKANSEDSSKSEILPPFFARLFPEMTLNEFGNQAKDLEFQKRTGSVCEACFVTFTSLEKEKAMKPILPGEWKGTQPLDPSKIKRRREETLGQIEMDRAHEGDSVLSEHASLLVRRVVNLSSPGLGKQFHSSKPPHKCRIPGRATESRLVKRLSQRVRLPSLSSLQSEKRAKKGGSLVASLDPSSPMNLMFPPAHSPCSGDLILASLDSYYPNKPDSDPKMQTSEDKAAPLRSSESMSFADSSLVSKPEKESFMSESEKVQEKHGLSTEDPQGSGAEENAEGNQREMKRAASVPASLQLNRVSRAFVKMWGEEHVGVPLKKIEKKEMGPGGVRTVVQPLSLSTLPLVGSMKFQKSALPYLHQIQGARILAGKSGITEVTDRYDRPFVRPGESISDLVAREAAKLGVTSWGLHGVRPDTRTTQPPSAPSRGRTSDGGSRGISRQTRPSRGVTRSRAFRTPQSRMSRSKAKMATPPEGQKRPAEEEGKEVEVETLERRPKAEERVGSAQGRTRVAKGAKEGEEGLVTEPTGLGSEQLRLLQEIHGDLDPASPPPAFEGEEADGVLEMNMEHLQRSSIIMSDVSQGPPFELVSERPDTAAAGQRHPNLMHASRHSQDASE